jgi:hypothetical protein
MMDSSHFYDTSVLPDDVFSLSNDAFFSMIQQLAGEQMVEILKIQLISSTQSLLRTNNIFEIFNINCPALSEIRGEGEGEFGIQLSTYRFGRTNLDVHIH